MADQSSSVTEGGLSGEIAAVRLRLSDRRGSDGSSGHIPSTCRHCSGRRSTPTELAVHHLEHDGGAGPDRRAGEFFHSTGAFRTGPPIAELEQLLGRFATATDPVALGSLTTDIDRFVYDQALSVFLCAPQALYAVNRQVAFDGYAATFELAETQVARQHWSRR